MVDKRIWHGTRLFVSSAAPDDATDASDWNASKFKSGAGVWKAAGELTNVGGEFGITRKDAISEPMDRDDVRVALYNIADYGNIELTFDRDDDDTGQAAFATGSADSAVWSVKILWSRKNTTSLPAGHHAEDGAAYLRGYVMGDSNPGGAGGDFVSRKVTLRLVTLPKYVDDPS